MSVYQPFKNWWWCTRHATLTVCYQLAQSVLKIGSGLACRKSGTWQGEVGRHSHDMLCTWQLSWLAIEKPWSALTWPFLSFFFYANRYRNHSSAFVGAREKHSLVRELWPSHRVQQARAHNTTPTGSIPNAHNGYFHIPDTVEFLIIRT